MMANLAVGHEECWQSLIDASRSVHWWCRQTKPAAGPHPGLPLTRWSSCPCWHPALASALLPIHLMTSACGCFPRMPYNSSKRCHNSYVIINISKTETDHFILSIYLCYCLKSMPSAKYVHQILTILDRYYVNNLKYRLQYFSFLSCASNSLQ